MTNYCGYCNKELKGAGFQNTFMCNYGCMEKYCCGEAGYARSRSYANDTVYTEIEIDSILHTKNTCYGDD
jgi:hypothetical protein